MRGVENYCGISKADNMSLNRTLIQEPPFVKLVHLLPLLPARRNHHYHRHRRCHLWRTADLWGQVSGMVKTTPFHTVSHLCVVGNGHSQTANANIGLYKNPQPPSNMGGWSRFEEKLLKRAFLSKGFIQN